jgi:hypothetical protein
MARKWSSFLRLPAFMSHLSELDYDFTLCFTPNWLMALCQLFLRYPFLANDRSLAEVGKQTFCLKSSNPQILGLILLTQICKFLVSFRYRKSKNF